MTQQALADLVGIDRKNLFQYEKGLVIPSFPIAMKLAQALHVDPSALWPETEQWREEILERERQLGLIPGHYRAAEQNHHN